MNVQTPPDKLKVKDYATDQEVRWCPGCGDYAIVRAMQNTMAELQAPPEKTVFISGIGCAARFPYYMATYGFHTIHGRAPTIATGVKVANPNLSGWMITGIRSCRRDDVQKLFPGKDELCATITQDISDLLRSEADYSRNSEPAARTS